MEEKIPSKSSKHVGFIPAAIASVGLIVSPIAALIAGAMAASELAEPGTPAGELPTGTMTALVLYISWAAAVAGTALAFAAIFVYGFRAKWFWIVLLVGSILYLFFPPVHTLLGIIGIILLVSFRHQFQRETKVAV